MSGLYIFANPFNGKALIRDTKKNNINRKIMISEVLRISPAIRELIKKKAISREIEDQARKEGMLTLAEDTVFRAVQGQIFVEEIL